MANQKAVIKQADAKRLFRAALEAGFKAATIVLHPDGRIEAAGTLDDVGGKSANSWDEILK